MESGSPLRRETVEQLALAEEFVRKRYRRGERPPLSEYTDRYPDHVPSRSWTCDPRPGHDGADRPEQRNRGP